MACALAVVYADAATMRSRLVHVAQHARALLRTGSYAGGGDAVGHALPTLALPRRPRYGFWHMGFESEEAYAAAAEVLRGHPFTSDCGSFGGRLVFEREASAFDGVAAVATCSLATGTGRLEDAEAFLDERFGSYGRLVSMHVPRLGRGNWDSGVGTVSLPDRESALRALLELDGTPSFVSGDNISVSPHQAYAPPADSNAAAALLIEQMRLLQIGLHVQDF